MHIAILKKMKVGFFIPLFLCSNSKAQENTIGFNFTPRAGVCFSYSGLDQQEKKTFKLSPDAGVEVKMDISKYVGITSGVFYMQKAKYFSYNTTQSFFTDIATSPFGGGAGTTDVILAALGTTATAINDTVYSNYSGKVNIHYLQIPLMATVDINNFSISAGGYMGIKLGARSTTTLTQHLPFLQTFEPLLSDSSIAPLIGFFTMAYPGLNKPYISTSTPDFIHSTDYGLVLELAGRFNERIKMTATATYGLTNYSTDEKKYAGKHFTINFNIGVSFGKLKGAVISRKLF